MKKLQSKLFSSLVLLSLLFSTFTASAYVNTLYSKRVQHDYQLLNSVSPTHQVVSLKLNPSLDEFSGQTKINLSFAEDVKRFNMHWIGLNIEQVVLLQGSKHRVLQVTDAHQYDMFWLGDNQVIKAGDYQLTVKFKAKFSKDALGLYKTNYQGHDYLFTQFQSLYARRVFPVFDEPSAKIPYQLILTVPNQLTAITNTPVKSSKQVGEFKTIVYETSPPMPSYLIAFAVGPLDKTPIEGLSVPGAIYSPKNSGSQTGYAVKHTPRILKTLEQYFGIKYPYKKLDFIAVPDYAFGAMENPGLVTYRTELLLRGDSASAGQAISTLNVIAHELAHMWYGDLVTMKWWDDLWLNEAFATWMAQKVLDDLYPQLRSALQLPQQAAFGEDALVATKAIRKEVKNNNDIEDGMGLNYTKGHAMLAMIEQLVGKETFQVAIQAYMKKYRWGNTVADDLWNEVSIASKQDIKSIANSFLNQPSFPLITFGEKGKVSQQRYRNLNAQVTEQNWQVPIAIKYKINGEIKRTSYVLTEQEGVFSPATEAQWVFPLDNGNGYYMWQSSPKQYQALLNDLSALTPKEQIALIMNSNGLITAGKMSMSEHFELLSKLSKTHDAVVFREIMENIKSTSELYLDNENKGKISRLVNDSLNPWYAKVGVKTQASDSDDVLALRPRLLRTLGQLGNNPKLVQELNDLALKYLGSPASVDASLGREALRIAAMKGNADLAKKYIDTYISTQDATLKSNIIASFYFVEKDAIDYILAEMLIDRIPSGDKARPISGLFYINKNHRYLYQWMDKNFDEFSQAIPENMQGYLPFIMGAQCRDENLAMLQVFFKDKGEAYQASISKIVESEKNCIALKQKEEASFNAFLENYSGLSE